eukprot:CAMPEP_0201654126 /NCGR_PEP_ID=MMETSP0493-20130528/45337_1 /ASSEMBLY_ACC=CAM_ASM_000838 /TAXON_ID=420259 /ORGANISM="Thalassiosira gravida, Strain GMp14c1" /LENGTH=399 /DNA_ID=CAMNT_0048130675 /DNA_START=61 /DNA_END=1260 /DNA_ORIENTATION=-
MEHIPDDISPLVVDYLSRLDAVNLSRTCRKLRSQLSLTTTSRRILTGFIKDDQNDERQYGFQIPVTLQVAVHSILVSMSWKDQGWGNLKGMVFLVAEDKTRTYDRSGRKGLDGGRVIRTSDIAPHTLENLSFSFTPRQHESYHLWYIVGGGGGHSLRLSNVSIQSLVFDDNARSFAKAHDFLRKSNIFHPWDVMARSPQVHQFHNDACKAILATTSHSLTHGLQVLPPMISFFSGYGVSSADLSIELIKSIESLWSEWEQDLSCYGNDGINRNEHAEGDLEEDVFNSLRSWRGRPHPSRIVNEGHPFFEQVERPHARYSDALGEYLTLAEPERMGERHDPHRRPLFEQVEHMVERHDGGGEEVMHLLANDNPMVTMGMRPDVPHPHRRRFSIRRRFGRR